MIDLSSSYMGLKIKSPIIAASSGLTNDVDSVMKLEQAGVGAIVLKSLFEEEIITEMSKNVSQLMSESYIYPETMDLFANYDVEDTLTNYLKLISDCKQAVKVPIIASINCVSAYNWPFFATSLQDAGADAVELNIPVLPSDLNKECGESERIYLKVLKEVKPKVHVPISLKISPYFSNLAGMMKQLSDNGANGIALFNRYYTPDFDIDNFELMSSHIFSSDSEYIMPLRWVAIMANRISADISATTGIHDGRTVIKMLLAGATSVQIASVLYLKGVGYVKVMLNELSKWMVQNGFTSISNFRGVMSQVKSTNPAALSRVQFMKHFSEKY